MYRNGISSKSYATVKQRDGDAGLTAELFALGSPTMCAVPKRKPIKNGH